MSVFRDEEIDWLDRSGWSRCASIAAVLASSGLPAPTAHYLARTFSKRQWLEAETAVAKLRDHFGAARFADGLLPAQPPDCDHNERWTFTVMAGEPLRNGLAESGTVLKGHVRFRLGKAVRGIGSARIAPAIRIA